MASGGGPESKTADPVRLRPHHQSAGPTPRATLPEEAAPPPPTQRKNIESPQAHAVSSSSSTTAPNDQDRRKIVVGNLNPDINEDYVYHLFSSYGAVKSCRVVVGRANNDATAHIEYESRKSAENAVEMMNKRTVNNRKIIVKFAPQSTSKKYYTVYVGNIGHLKAEDLKDHFKRFGNILKVSVKLNMSSGRANSFAFVDFDDESAADEAIKEMDGAWVANKYIRVNWAHSTLNRYSINPDLGNDELNETIPLYKEVSKSAHVNNRTIFCYYDGRITEEFLRKEFSPFGSIFHINYIPGKSFGFVKFLYRHSAVKAICLKNEQVVDGHIMKVSWGTEKSYDNSHSDYMRQVVTWNQNHCPDTNYPRLFYGNNGATLSGMANNPPPGPGYGYSTGPSAAPSQTPSFYPYQVLQSQQPQPSPFYGRWNENQFPPLTPYGNAVPQQQQQHQQQQHQHQQQQHQHQQQQHQQQQQQHQHQQQQHPTPSYQPRPPPGLSSPGPLQNFPGPGQLRNFQGPGPGPALGPRNAPPPPHSMGPSGDGNAAGISSFNDWIKWCENRRMQMQGARK